MEYKEVIFQVEPPAPWSDILINALVELGYESFEETQGGCKAYIQADKFDESKLKEINLGKEFNQKIEVNYTHQEVQNINWNEEWEKNYEPVLIKEKCYIRAPFHKPRPDLPLEIVIEPKMSFGTGHHKTTVLVLEFLLETDFRGKSVLDMGCGTGLLAIIAAKFGAHKVTAIDNHIYAYENTIENKNNNNVDVKVLHGESDLLGEEFYDIIIANITKNILLDDMSKYVAVLNKGGTLFLSGFFEKDIKDIQKKTDELGLTLKGKKTDENWTALKLIKE